LLAAQRKGGDCSTLIELTGGEGQSPLVMVSCGSLQSNTVEMMKSKIPVLFSIILLALVFPGALRAQGSDDDGPSLGDVARNLRKNKAAEQQTQPAPDRPRAVIDNDNLAQAMEEAKKARPVIENKTVLSIDPSGNTLRVTSPDATCSLSFNAQASSLLVKPALIETLPLDQLVKLDGPGSIQDDNLQLDLFNGTDWELREVTIGLILERRPGYNAEMAAQARVVPASKTGAPATVEKQSDVTLLYHLKLETKAFSKVTIRSNIGITPAADEDWRWSVVEAQGIRPAGAGVAPESLSEPLEGKKPEPVPEER